MHACTCTRCPRAGPHLGRPLFSSSLLSISLPRVSSLPVSFSPLSPSPTPPFPRGLPLFTGALCSLPLLPSHASSHPPFSCLSPTCFPWLLSFQSTPFPEFLFSPLSLFPHPQILSPLLRCLRLLLPTFLWSLFLLPPLPRSRSGASQQQASCRGCPGGAGPVARGGPTAG